MDSGEEANNKCDVIVSVNIHDERYEVDRGASYVALYWLSKITKQIYSANFMDLNGKAAAAAWCFCFIHVDVKLMGPQVSGEDTKEEPSDVEPEKQIPVYGQENKNLLATLFQICKS